MLVTVIRSASSCHSLATDALWERRVRRMSGWTHTLIFLVITKGGRSGRRSGRRSRRENGLAGIVTS